MRNSKIILGTVQMGLNYGVNNSNGKISEQESHDILAHAWKAGIQYLDTAAAYGNAHEVIGNFHRNNPDKVFSVITKIPAVDSVVNAEEKIQTYLHALAVFKLETLMFHSFDVFQKHQHLLATLTSLKKQGLFSQLGVSVYTNAELDSLINEDTVDVIQLPFNLLDNLSQRGDLIAKAKANNKIIHTRSAFLQGLFFKPLDDQHKIVQALRPQLTRINEIAVAENVPMEALALSYCLHQKNIDQVLIGVDSVHHLNMNLKAANYKLDERTIERIDRIHTDNISLLNPSLWN